MTGSVTNAFEELVGPGKKFADQEALAKGKLESDSFISSLTAETALLREQLAQTAAEADRAKVLQELLDNLKTTKPEKTEMSEAIKPETVPNQTTAPTLDEIVKAIDERETARKLEANKATAYGNLAKVYGDKAEAAVAEKASALGLTVEYLNNLASHSPQAFASLMGATGAPASTSMTRQGSTNTTPAQPFGGAVRNKAYYDGLMKEKGSLAFVMDRNLQIQLHKDMTALGDAWDA